MRKAALVCFLVGLASLREARGSQTIVDLLPETSLTILDQQARDDLRESLDTAVDASIARLELRRNKFVVDHWVKDGMVLVEFADGTQGVIYKSLPQEADSPYSPSHRLGDFYDRLRRADPRLDAPEGTQSFAVTHDADVDQSNPAMNYGSNAYAFVGSIGGFSQLAFFRAAAVSVIGQVTYGDFAVYWETCAGYNGGLGQFNARPVASTWSESTINYSNQPGYRATAPSSVQFTQCSPSSTVNHFDWLYFEMTDWITNWHLGSWPHYGVRIDLGNSGLPGFPNFKFSTSESVAAQRPEFYVEYDTCWYTVSPTSCTLPANASTCSFGVTTLSQCDWSTNESLSWLTVTSGSTGRGSGTVTYSVAANSGAQRSGNVSVQGQVHTVTQEGAAATLTSVTVSGSATVPESSGAQYTATANWSDGTTTNVTNSSSWSETCAAATISSTGFLTTSAVTSNQPCQVSASYTSGTTQTGSLSITILNTTATLTSVTVSGSTTVPESSGAQYTATANWSDGTTTNVTNSSSWSETCAAATISSTGFLTTSAVTSNQPCQVSASYTSGTTQTGSLSITILNTTATLTSVTVSGSTTVPESSGAQYTATANWSDGTTTNVTNSSSWSETCAAATISSTGFLTTSAVTSNQPCQVSASYTSGTTQTGSLSITILNTTATLTSVTVSGSSTVPESSGAQYTATANWSDGTTTNVTNSSSWSETCAAATISSTGFLTTSAVTSNQPCQVSASYTSGTTQTGSLSITITETGGNCTLQVLSPNGGETWIIGSTVSASWTTSGTGCPAQVRIEIYKGGVMHAYFPSAFPPTQSVNFLVDSSWATPGNDYRLRMSDWNNSQFYDESNANFSIQNNCSYSISPTTGGFGPGGGTGSFAVTAPAGCPWSASSNQTWASITSGGSGSGSGTVSYSVAAYGGTGTRAAAITAGGLTHSITQTGSTQSCTLHVLSPNGGEVWIAGATATRAYTSSGTGCPTELRLELYRSGVMAEAWPNPQPPSSSVTFVVGPGHADGNDYRLRISDWNNSQFYDESDADFSIFNSPCTYSINPTGASVGAGGGSGSVAVTTSSGCGWTASSNSNWLSVTSGTSGNGSGNVQYSVASNAGGARTGTITIAGRVFTITQSPGTSTGCAPGWDTLCLMGNRFEVRATYTDYANNTGSGQAVALTADSGYFWFFDPSNVEAVGKIVSFCGTNGSFGYYAGGLTDVGVTMTVRDTVANQTQTFTNARGHRFDMISSAFNTCQGSDGPEETSISQPGSSEYSQPSPSEDLALPFEAAESSDLGAEIESLLRTAVAAAAPSRAVSTDSASEEWGEDNDAADGVVWSESQDVGRTPCFASSTTLCLYNNRFEVRATYTDYSNNSGPGQAVALTSDSGYFWFFDSSNVEAVGKMVSFCGTNGSFGFYAGGLTDVGVVMTVRDTVANQTQTFTNARGHRFNMISSAFNTCP